MSHLKLVYSHPNMGLLPPTHTRTHTPRPPVESAPLFLSVLGFLVACLTKSKQQTRGKQELVGCNKTLLSNSSVTLSKLLPSKPQFQHL